MKAIENIQHFINNLEEKTFYLYLMGVFAVLFGIMGMIIFHYYSNINSLQERIDTINEQRIKVKRLLAINAQVKKHRAEVDTILASEEGFKISGYFKDLLARLGLSNKYVVHYTSTVKHENKYEEHTYKVQLTDMNMKQLCELLNALDQKKRIYTKELEITKTKQARKSLDVTLTIATLEPLTTPV